MGHDNRVALSHTHMIRSNVIRLFIEAKGMINVNRMWKYDKRWRWCYCDFLALLLGGGFAVISVGDVLSRCSFIMFLSFCTG